LDTEPADVSAAGVSSYLQRYDTIQRRHEIAEDVLTSVRRRHSQIPV